MFRSILFNLWIALIAFAVYFSMTIYQSSSTAQPLPTILKSFMWAAIAFVVAFALKYILNYVLYTPGQPELSIIEEGTGIDTTNQAGVQEQKNTSSTVEFADESNEDIAQVVRTMLSNE